MGHQEVLQTHPSYKLTFKDCVPEGRGQSLWVVEEELSLKAAPWGLDISLVPFTSPGDREGILIRIFIFCDWRAVRKCLGGGVILFLLLHMRSRHEHSSVGTLGNRKEGPWHPGPSFLFSEKILNHSRSTVIQMPC